LVAFWLFCGGT